MFLWVGFERDHRLGRYSTIFIAVAASVMIMGVRRGAQGGAFAPPGFGHLVKHLVKILTFCVTILTFGQNTNIFSTLKKFAPPTKIPVDAHDHDHHHLFSKLLFVSRAIESDVSPCIYEVPQLSLNIVHSGCNPSTFKSSFIQQFPSITSLCPFPHMSPLPPSPHISTGCMRHPVIHTFLLRMSKPPQSATPVFVSRHLSFLTSACIFNMKNIAPLKILYH